MLDTARARDQEYDLTHMRLENAEIFRSYTRKCKDTLTSAWRPPGIPRALSRCSGWSIGLASSTGMRYISSIRTPGGRAQFLKKRRSEIARTGRGCPGS